MLLMHSEEYMASSWPVRDRTYSVNWRPHYFERITPTTWASTRKSCEPLHVHSYQHCTTADRRRPEPYCRIVWSCKS